MKKFFFALLVGLTIVFAATQVEAAYPAQDTYVLTWDGYDYYVKAGSLDYRNANVDAAPEFSCRVAHNGKVRHYEFRARGYAVLYVDGELYGDSRSHHGRFVDAMYNAICDKLIYRR